MGGDTLTIIGYVIASGGLGATIKAFVDYMRDRAASRAVVVQVDATAGKVTADRDSVTVKTAEDVVMFVRRELSSMASQLDAQREETEGLREEVRTLIDHVSTLEQALREHQLPVPRRPPRPRAVRPAAS